MSRNKEITDEMVKTVMEDVYVGSIGVIKGLKKQHQEKYTEAMMNRTREALEKAFEGYHVMTDAQLDKIHSDGFRQGLSDYD